MGIDAAKTPIRWIRLWLRGMRPKHKAYKKRFSCLVANVHPTFADDGVSVQRRWLSSLGAVGTLDEGIWLHSDVARREVESRL